MHMSLGNGYLFILRLGMALCILYYFFGKIPFSDVIEAIAHTKTSYVVPALILSIFLQLILAMRLRILTLMHGLSLSTLLF